MGSSKYIFLSIGITIVIVIGIQLLALQLESGILNSTESDLENTVKSEKATPKRISVLEVEKLLENGRVTIADIRDKKSYLTSNIPDSIHLSQDNLEEFMKNTNAEEPLLIYCYHGINSIKTAKYFVSQGFKNVYSLDGGYSEYSKKSKSRP